MLLLVWSTGNCCSSIADRYVGIGRQTAISFVVEGCQKIALADRDEAGLTETIALLQNTAAPAVIETISSAVDISQEEQVQAFVNMVVEKFGRIDYAVNSAGEKSSICCASHLTLKFGRHLE